MLPKIRARFEFATTLLTLVGPFAGVDALVQNHVALLQERLAAVAARKGLLAGVGLLVQPEGGLRFGGVRASGALEGPVSPVHPIHVRCKVDRRLEALAALL